MRILITIIGAFLGGVSLIMTHPNGYSAYTVPQECELNERRPNYLDPHSFYWCLGDGPVLMKCVAGTFFNVTVGRCTEEIKVNSNEVAVPVPAEEQKEEIRCEQPKTAPRGVICPAIDPLDHSIYYADPDACECFYQCDNRVAKRIPCRKGLHFNVTTNLCDWPEEAGCQPSDSFGKENDYNNDNNILPSINLI